MPMDERQQDIRVVVEQYQQILVSLAGKTNVSLATMVEGVAMLSRILRTDHQPAELQRLLAKNGMIEALLDAASATTNSLEPAQKRTLLPVVASRISLLLKGCEAAEGRMRRCKGYERLFDVISGLGVPADSNTLHSVLAMALHGEDPTVGGEARTIRTIEPVLYLLKWIETGGERAKKEDEDNEEELEQPASNVEQQAWLLLHARKT